MSKEKTSLKAEFETPEEIRAQEVPTPEPSQKVIQVSEMDAWILKLDISGNILSQTSRGGLENDELVSMVLDNNQAPTSQIVIMRAD